jgi:hypothetical protein
MENTILTTLLYYNPWIENPEGWSNAVQAHLPQAEGRPYIGRFADSNRNWPQQHKVNLVIGPRQAGKSTFIWHTLSSLGPKILYVNANELSLRQWCDSPARVAAEISEILPDPRGLFFEEVQYLENAGLFLKGLADLHLGIPIFATGSSSYHLLDQMRESLSGRAERVLLLPFSLNEWESEVKSKADAIYQHEMNKHFHRALVYGSYPEVSFSDQTQIVLNRLLEAFVIRDASDTFRIKHVAKFRQLLVLMAGQISNLVNYTEWSSATGLDVKTVESYAGILEESHIIRLLPPFVGGKRAEIISTPKIFFVDNGIRNQMINQFNEFEVRADRGVLFENWVFSELLKNSAFTDTLHFWRSKGGAEVDFVRQRGDCIEAFEAKATHLKNRKLSRSARSFIDAYGPDTFTLINLNLNQEERTNKTRIRFVDPLKFLQNIGHR